MKAINRPQVSLQSLNVSGQLRKRHASGKRFKLYGILSILFALLFMITLFSTLVHRGWTAFIRTEIWLTTETHGENIAHDQEYLDYILGQGLKKELGLTELANTEDLLALLSADSSRTLHHHMKAHETTGKLRATFSLKASNFVDAWYKTRRFRPHELNHTNFGLSTKQLEWLNMLWENGRIRFVFNKGFFAGGDSQEPEIAGIYSALIGSLLTLGIAITIALPISLATAIYLEEFAPRGRFFDFLEININNLAAIPTIIFGLLGLAFFLNILKIPRSASLAGGLTLSLIIMPTIIIASRTALKTVPRSIRYAAQAVGASTVQTVFHHVIPLALPGILTGTLLGLVRAMGESAPLLMLGMVAFIVEPPQSLLDPATVLPVQIFSWAKNPSRGFIENTSAATLVLLLFLFAFNCIIVWLRRKFEKKW